MNAKDIMTANPISLTEDKLVKDAADLMTEKSISALPITNAEGKLVGIITESDFVGKAVDIPHALVSIKQLFKENFHHADVELICAKVKEKPLKNVMSTKLYTVEEDHSLNQIVNLMIDKGLKRIPVLNNGELSGIITRKDIVKAFASS
ncbi:MAG: CBS domain-containing protein [Bacteriovoracaceae bacterium]